MGVIRLGGLQSYIARRLLVILPMLLGVSCLLFTLMQLAPGGPEMVMIGDLQMFSPELVQQIREKFALDKPIYVRYLRWLGNAIQGDFGVSTTGAGGVPSIQLVAERLGATIQLTGGALLLAVVVSIPLGIVSAVKRYQVIDQVTTVLSFIWICMPSFWLGVVSILIFSVLLDWLPASGIAPPGMRDDILLRLKYAILPTVTLAAVQMGRYMRYVRSSMIEVLREDYIRTARAKGLAERAVLYKHALRNSMISVVTIVGLSLRALVGGSVMTETVFAWPGIGRLAFNSIKRRDYNTVMVVTLVVAVVVLVANLVVDVVYAMIDPRIRYE